jgi:WhiB family redox-sensing transcriptional regulator
MFSWDEAVKTLRRRQLDWAEDVPCLNMTSEMYNPYQAAQLRATKKFCSNCDAKYDCLVMALVTEETFGVWGGTTEKDRAPLLKKLEEIPPTETKLKIITTLAKERIVQDETNREDTRRVDSLSG